MNVKELYNNIEKEEFLSSLENEDVQRVYYYIFLKTKNTEKLYEKDLYHFTLKQFADIMKNINPATINSAINAKSRLSHYVTWAIQNGRKTNNTNPLQGTGAEWEKQFIDKTVKRHYSELELYEIVESLYNAQDQALVQCIYEGILGRGFSELLSMRESKIDWDNNIVYVTDSRTQTERAVKLSDRCMKLIFNALKENKYIPEISEVEKDLIDYKDYVFKNVEWRSSVHDKVTAQMLSKRLGSIKVAHELDFFRAKDLQESGKIKMAYELGKDKGYIDKEDYEIIGNHYNMRKVRSGKYLYHNATLLKQYITSENLKKLYGIDCRVE